MYPQPVDLLSRMYCCERVPQPGVGTQHRAAAALCQHSRRHVELGANQAKHGMPPLALRKTRDVIGLHVNFGFQVAGCLPAQHVVEAIGQNLARCRAA